MIQYPKCFRFNLGGDYWMAAFAGHDNLRDDVNRMMSPDLLFWFALALKMAMTAAIVVIVSVAVERSGPFIGALIAALPSAAGAAYIILAIEHPPSFIAASITSHNAGSFPSIRSSRSPRLTPSVRRKLAT